MSMNKVSTLVACVLLLVIYTQGNAADLLSVVHWQKFESKSVSALVKAIEDSTGQSWKMYSWQPPNLFLTIPYSAKEDLQLQLLVQNPPELQGKSIAHWQTDALMKTIIVSVAQATSVLKISDEYASDFHCLMKAVEYMHQTGYSEGLRTVAIETVTDPARLDSSVIARLRDFCHKLSTGEIKK